MEDRCDELGFMHSHQDPRSAFLDILELLKALARDTDEKCIAVGARQRRGQVSQNLTE